MKKSLSMLFVLSLLLMSFQCEDEPSEVIITNNFKATISDIDLSLNDTLWITGRVSSQAFNETLGDSIPNDFNNGDLVSIYKLRPAMDQSNSVDAINNFEIIEEVGQTSRLGACPNGGLAIEGTLSEDSSEYRYKIGLKPVVEGDYVLSWNFDTSITNTDRNTEILSNYPVDGNPNTLEFDNCGIVSTLPNIDASTKLYFFSVD
ncbi:hypothetical protein [uncultured Dokdonia sp.]|uniref:hypothetical protein n=1 Tax=uncultured Dokdonia sp. TaxID=575653 RepID=UPI00261655AB|nr:hypothetical protein [uncultured Dokdonia sp.]